MIHQKWQSFIVCAVLALLAGANLYTSSHTRDLTEKYGCGFFAVSLFCFAAVTGKRGTEGKGL